MKQWIFGHHAVEAAIEAGKRTIYGLYVTDAQADRYIPLLSKKDKVAIHRLTPREMERKFEGKVHQGVAIQVSPLEQNLVLEDVMATSQLIVILDQVTDPHNLGACIRSANAFGADAVLIPLHGSAPLSDVAAKASVGATEHTPVVTLPSLNNAIEKLKAENFWIVGLDGYAEQELSQIDLKGKLVIIMGSEGNGMRPLVKQNCDFLAKLPMVGQVESLNVSVATGVALYEALKQRRS